MEKDYRRLGGVERAHTIVAGVGRVPDGDVVVARHQIDIRHRSKEQNVVGGRSALVQEIPRRREGGRLM